MEAARRASPADLDRVATLAEAAAAELAPARGGPVWSVREARPEPQRVSLADALDDPSHLVLVGTIDESVVGYAATAIETLRDGSQLAVVSEIYVEPGARQVGVGEALMEGILAWAGERGCRGVDAIVLPGNRAAKNFFERFGLVARAILVHRPLAGERAR